MGKSRIDMMVDKFLCWEFPKDFTPDGRISFDRRPDGRGYTPTWPVGKSLLDARQAKQMVSAIDVPDDEVLELMEETASMLRGMTMDPAIPEHAKRTMRARITALEAAVEIRVDC